MLDTTVYDISYEEIMHNHYFRFRLRLRLIAVGQVIFSPSDFGNAVKMIIMN